MKYRAFEKMSALRTSQSTRTKESPFPCYSHGAAEYPRRHHSGFQHFSSLCKQITRQIIWLCIPEPQAGHSLNWILFSNFPGKWKDLPRLQTAQGLSSHGRGYYLTGCTGAEFEEIPWILDFSDMVAPKDILGRIHWGLRNEVDFWKVKLVGCRDNVCALATSSKKPGHDIYKHVNKEVWEFYITSIKVN